MCAMSRTNFSLSDRERQIRDAALEEAAQIVEGTSLPDSYSDPVMKEVADEIRRLKNVPERP